MAPPTPAMSRAPGRRPPPGCAGPPRGRSARTWPQFRADLGGAGEQASGQAGQQRRRLAPQHQAQQDDGHLRQAVGPAQAGRQPVRARRTSRRRRGRPSPARRQPAAPRPRRSPARPPPATGARRRRRAVRPRPRIRVPGNCPGRRAAPRSGRRRARSGQGPQTEGDGEQRQEDDGQRRGKEAALAPHPGAKAGFSQLVVFGGFRVDRGARTFRPQCQAPARAASAPSGASHQRSSAPIRPPSQALLVASAPLAEPFFSCTPSSSGMRML